MQDFTVIVFQGKGKYRITDSCVVTDEGPMQVEIINQHAFIGDKTPLMTETWNKIKWIEFSEKVLWKSLEVDDKFYTLWNGPMLANGFCQHDGRQYVSETKEQEEERHKRMKAEEFALPIDISKISRITVRGGVDVVMSVSKTSDDFITDVLEGAKFCSSVKKAVTPAHSSEDHLKRSKFQDSAKYWENIGEQIEWFAHLPVAEKKVLSRHVAVCEKRILNHGEDYEEVVRASRKQNPYGTIHIADNNNPEYILNAMVKRIGEKIDNSPSSKPLKEQDEWFSLLSVKQKTSLGKWVAVGGLKVLASGDDSEDVFDIARKAQPEAPILIIENAYFTQFPQ